jgi:rRNA-processing protein FCF1
VLYILDADTIIQRPEVLAYAAQGDLLIPQAAVDEIRGREARGLRADLKNLLDRAIAAGAVVAPPADGGIAELAFQLAGESGPENVRVVTTDRRLVRRLATKGVTSIAGRRLLAELPPASTDAGIEQAARRIVSMQHLNLLTGFGIALAATGVATLVVLNHQLIFHTAPAWIAPFVILLVGLLFFWWREHGRLSYGLFEAMAGLLIASQSIVTLPAPYELSTAKSIQLLGGLYVMVRGLDNIDRGIDDTRLGVWWKRLFRPNW